MAPDATPALTDLTDKQQAFIAAYVGNGGDHIAAALDAGYSTPGEGSRLLKHPLVAKHLQQAICDELSTGSAIAIGVVRNLMQHAKSDYVKLEAARDWLDRAGYKPPDKALVKVSGDLTVSFDIAPRGEGG